MAEPVKIKDLLLFFVCWLIIVGMCYLAVHFMKEIDIDLGWKVFIGVIAGAAVVFVVIKAGEKLT
jgi:hypothetical protein